MDQDARRRLLEQAISILDGKDTLIVVPMDEFFDGNTDEGCIGVNLPPDWHIGLAGYRSLFDGIRQRPDVQEVFIELTEVPYPDDEDEADLWPVGCVAFVITSAPLEEVEKWVEPIHPREVAEGWHTREGVETPSVNDQMRPVRVWLL